MKFFMHGDKQYLESGIENDTTASCRQQLFQGRDKLLSNMLPARFFQSVAKRIELAGQNC